MIVIGSKVRVKGKPIKGVSFKVLSIDRWQNAKIKHSISGVVYEAVIYELELIK